MTRILFVCHGNICRSVMAEMILKHMVAEAGRDVDFLIDSCATSTEEIGNDIYPPAKRCLTAHDIPFTRHEARQITRHDFDSFDHIYCMDRNNLRNIRRMFGDDYASRVQPLMSLVTSPSPEGAWGCPDVADPWYTGDFEATYRDVVAGCKEIMKM